jgi:hypothetical protein
VWAAGLYVWRLVDRSMMRYALEAISEDEDGAAATGVHVTAEKLKITVLSAVMTALAGALYCQYQMFISPDTVSGIAISLQMVFAVVVGGIYVSLGPTVGAVITIMLAEVLRISFGTRAVGWDNLVYGVLLVLFIIFLPRGIGGSVQSLTRRLRMDLELKGKIAVVTGTSVGPRARDRQGAGRVRACRPWSSRGGASCSRPSRTRSSGQVRHGRCRCRSICTQPTPRRRIVTPALSALRARRHPDQQRRRLAADPVGLARCGLGRVVLDQLHRRATAHADLAAGDDRAPVGPRRLRHRSAEPSGVNAAVAAKAGVHAWPRGSPRDGQARDHDQLPLPGRIHSEQIDQRLHPYAREPGRVRAQHSARYFGDPADLGIWPPSCAHQGALHHRRAHRRRRRPAPRDLSALWRRISRDLFAFLGELRRHNNREWFNANKDRYLAEVREPMVAFIASIAAPLARISRQSGSIRSRRAAR